MLFDAEEAGSAGLEVRIELEVPEHHDADLQRWPLEFAIDIPTWAAGRWGDGHPTWVIDAPFRFRTRVWTAVITMNANPNQPGLEPGRPEPGAVRAAFEDALQPIEASMNGQVEGQG